jgi:hypothetical protein
MRRGAQGKHCFTFSKRIFVRCFVLGPQASIYAEKRDISMILEERRKIKYINICGLDRGIGRMIFQTRRGWGGRRNSLPGSVTKYSKVLLLKGLRGPEGVEIG